MDNNTLLEVLEDLKNRGYTEEFRLHKNPTHLHAISKDIILEPKDFTVTEAYRFEGSGSEEDVSEIYAIDSPANNLKGFLVDELDEFRKLPDHPTIEKLQIEKTVLVYDDSNEEQKYGVPKVYKSKYNENPERYELRKNFPDFPPCPFGNSFSMLGYDKQENRYVWLVSSIIKDDQLSINDYEN